MKTINLDHNATTKPDPRVVEAVAAAMVEFPGNSSSGHSLGRKSRNALERAREMIADFCRVSPKEIIFQSGGTEGINHILRGMKKGPVITSNVEHAAVYATLKQFPDVHYLEAGEFGAVTPTALLEALKKKACPVVLIAANNETGVLSDIEGFARVADQAGVPLILDGVCLLGKETLFIPERLSAVVFSGHKFYAPKGVGFTILRRGFKIDPLITGGHQEQGCRGGTENLPAILGMAKAIEIISNEHQPEKITRLRQEFEKKLLNALDFAQINGAGPRICNTSNIAFPGINGETLLAALDLKGIAASHGSACSSGGAEPSRILLSMGYPYERVRSSIRFSLGHETSADEMNEATAIIIQEAMKLKTS